MAPRPAGSAPRRGGGGAVSMAAVGALGSVLALAACSPGPTAGPTGSGAPASSPAASASASPSPTPSATPASPRPSPTVTREPVYVSPLDGLPAAGPAPVLVVKLDNTRYAQPHAGLTRADVVYIEEVEYGITRLAAVFSGAVPERIGPVRSARITDIDLLAEYGRPAFAYSGAQRRMFPALDAAPFHDVSPRRGGDGYSRDSSRRAPYNYYIDGQAALAGAPKAALAKDIGFAFDQTPPDGGLTAKKARMAWGYASAGFDYDRVTGRYKVSLNGERARAEEAENGQMASTVVIQYVEQTPSPYFDKGGGNTPHAQTIGSGKAVVLRDGRAWDVTWERPSADAGTTYRLADGSVMPFKPGQVWVVLLDRTRPATITPLKQPASAAGSDATASASASASSSASEGVDQG